MVYTTSGAVAMKAGKNVSASLTEAHWNNYIKQAEALVNNVARKNFSGSYATYREEVKATMEEIASNIAAIYAIQWDMGGYTRVEAENMINILRDAALRGLSIIKDKKVQDFIDGA